MILSNELDFNKRPIHTALNKKNLTTGEFQAITQLQKLDDKIVIKSADKGSAVVVLNKSDYIKEAEKQLSNKDFYLPLEENMTDTYNNEILTYITKMYDNGEIDISVLNYILDTDKRTSKFYLLPKIHKGITPPPGRPIISAIGSPTEKISQLVDHFLNPPTTLNKSYVKDTTHFLQILEEMGPLPEGSILVTLDVTSLYTNIPNTEGIKAANDILKRSRSRHYKPSNKSLIQLLEFVLTRNNFQFNGKHYLQTGGTSMGTKAAPSYANCYLDKFERDFVYKYKLQPLLWKRYLDDCFCIWQHGEEELNLFVKYLNSCVESIKFTMEHSKDGVAFLDTWVSLVENKIVTNLYCKPTDSHNYLLYSSSHPKACKNSIPFSQFIRIRRICSNISDFDKHAITFGNHFNKRGYSDELIESAIIKARRLNRSDLIKPKTKNAEVEKDNKNILITDFHPTDNTLREIVHENWDLLGKSQNTIPLYTNRPITGYRRPKNLKDILVRAEIRTKKELEIEKRNKSKKISAATLIFPETNPKPALLQTSMLNFLNKGTPPTKTTSLPNLNKDKDQPTLVTNKGETKHIISKNACRNFRCKICPIMDKTDKIVCHVTQQLHNCKTNVTCNSSNLVYCICCKKCGQQYVGETSRKISERIGEHLLNIRHLSSHNKNPLYKIPPSFVPHNVGLHFSQNNHNGTKDVRVKILDFINFHPASPRAKTTRLRIEKKWIHTLKTPAPQGLNMMD
jgi:hypothetical protein